MNDQATLEQRLDAFDPSERRDALQQLAALELPAPPAGANINMHFHSFFSYNAEGWSPSHIAWEASRHGLYAAALCDFDVLDGLEEFIEAGELLGLRTCVNLETRVYLAEYSHVDITSPGEPGVTYIMGAGFTSVPAAGSPQADGLSIFRDGARERNIDLVDRINPHIPQIAIDYEKDVLPLTPTGSATERHIIRAYVEKAEAVFGTPDAVSEFWSGVTGKAADEVKAMLGTPKLEEAARSKLAKRGGLGYVAPSEDTFPPVDEFIAWVLSCKAIPMITWLDGTSGGEQDGRAMLECMVGKGCAAMNIVPDRNWNISDPDERATKIANLIDIVQIADDMDLPVNIGTEMNKAGLPFTDDLSGEVLGQFKDSFLRGARIMVGHSILLRYAGCSYTSCDCPLADRNAFFEGVGALPPLSECVAGKLSDMGEESALDAIKASVEAKQWKVG